MQFRSHQDDLTADFSVAANSYMLTATGKKRHRDAYPSLPFMKCGSLTIKKFLVGVCGYGEAS